MRGMSDRTIRLRIEVDAFCASPMAWEIRLASWALKSTVTVSESFNDDSLLMLNAAINIKMASKMPKPSARRVRTFSSENDIIV